MQVKQIVNSVFTSNTYIVSEDNSDYVWLIDVGDIEGVLSELSNDTVVRGVFVTHPHFDHIYGINKLIDSFPDCIVFTSEDGKNGLFSDKLNLSYYHQDPVIFLGSNIRILTETDKIELFGDCLLETIETPGHNWGCLSYKVNEHFFTGDSFIPNVEVVTKLKGGDRAANKESLIKIRNNISDKTIICPGHGEMTRIKI
jgi:glyoxylase-like metal-dependent hydrolase (beta-lactamase superfamily II)